MEQQETQELEETKTVAAKAPSRHYRVCFLAGTGLGPELVAHAHQTLEALGTLHGFAVEADYPAFAAEAFQQHGRDLPEETTRRCAAADAVLVLDQQPGLGELLQAVSGSSRRSLSLSPRGAWLDDDDQAPTQSWQGQTVIVAMASRESEHLAGQGLADPRPALEASCLLLEILGERTAATTLARTLYHHAREIRDAQETSQARVAALLGGLERRRADVGEAA